MVNAIKNKAGKRNGSVSGNEEIAILNMVAWERPNRKCNIKGAEDDVGWGELK